MATGSQYLADLPNYSEEQKTHIRYAFDLHGEVKALREETTEPEFRASLATAMRAQSAARPDILFVGFRANEQTKVDSIAAGFGLVATLVESGLANVGIYSNFYSTPYELLFGKHALRSGASYLLRKDKVTSVLTEIRNSLSRRWIIRNSVGAKDAASWSAGTKIEIGSSWAGGGMFSAGVLLHEIGHYNGLVDVCSMPECCGKFLRIEHFRPAFTTEQLECERNEVHGPQASKGSGHFIGLKRAKLLATTQKNLTVWNADSYRWYCSYFHKQEINAGAPTRIRSW